MEIRNPDLADGGAVVARPMMRVEEAAQYLDIGRAKAWAMVAQGELPSVKIGKCRRVPLDALRRWIEEQTEMTKQAA